MFEHVQSFNVVKYAARRAGLDWQERNYLATPKPPSSIQLEGKALARFRIAPAESLLYVNYPNEARPRDLVIEF